MDDNTAQGFAQDQPERSGTQPLPARRASDARHPADRVPDARVPSEHAPAGEPARERTLNDRAQNARTPAARAPYTPYRRQIHHVTQEPINDVEPEYVTLNRYETLESRAARPARPARSSHPVRNGTRKHMGVATSDPTYLEPVDATHRGSDAAGPAAASPERTGQRAPLNYSRYLETPKPGKTIFAGRGRKKPLTRFIPALIAVVVVALIAWFLFLR